MLIEDVRDMIAKARGHNPDRCNERCQCYRLALDIMVHVQSRIETRENELLEKLNERTDKLLRLQRLVGEEA